MHKSFIAIAFVLALVGAIAGGLFGRLQNSVSADATITTARISTDYREALDVISENYGGKADRESIADTSIQAMLWTLDPHSSFFTNAEFKRLSEEQASQF